MIPLGERPQGKALLDLCKKGDRLVVYAADRLGAGITGLGTVIDLTSRGVEVISIREPKATSEEDWRVLFTTASVFLGQNHHVIQHGIKQAKLRGTHCGRPKRYIPDDVLQEIRNRIAKGESLRLLCDEFGLPNGTIRRRLAEKQESQAVSAATTSRRNLALRDVVSTSEISNSGYADGGWLLTRIDKAAKWEIGLHSRDPLVGCFYGGLEIRKPLREGDVLEIYTNFMGGAGGYYRVSIEVLVYHREANSTSVVALTENVYCHPEKMGQPHFDGHK
jgi:acyl-CoA hydrolase